MVTDQIYISITGLEIKRLWHTPRFWFHALRSMAQARRAQGNLSADVRQIHGVQHTVTTWKSRADMQAFVYSGAHGQAVKAFPKFATGKTLGYPGKAPPPWDDVPAIWRERGKTYT